MIWLLIEVGGTLVANQPTYEDNWTDFTWDNVDGTVFYWSAWIDNKYFVPLLYWNAIWNGSFSMKVLWKQKVWWWSNVEYNWTQIYLSTPKYKLVVNGTNDSTAVIPNWRNFSTKDQDNDTHASNCSFMYHTPRWMWDCHGWTPLWGDRDWNYNTINWSSNNYNYTMILIK